MEAAAANNTSTTELVGPNTPVDAYEFVATNKSMIATRRPAADDLVRARIPREIKNRAFSALDELGIKPSEFIRMAFSQVAKTGKLPSELEKNRRATHKAVADVKAGRVKKFASVTDLMTDLNSDEE